MDQDVIIVKITARFVQMKLYVKHVRKDFYVNNGTCDNCTNFDENCATCDSTGCLTCKGNYKLDKDGNCALNSTWYT